MINNNISNLNDRTNIPYGAIKDVVPKDVGQRLPENLQNIDAKDIATNNGAVATAANADKNSLLGTLGVYFPFIALRTINDKVGSPFTFAGEYEKTFLGKLAKIGDGIQNGISKLIPDKIETGIANKFKQAKDFILNHSGTARSFTTPLNLESSMAKSEANGLFGRVMFDNADMFEKGFRGKDIKKIFEVTDGSSSFWNLLKSRGIDSVDGDDAIELVGKVFREIGSQPVKSSEVQNYVKDITKTLSSSGEKITISKWGPIPISKVPVLGKLFELNVPTSEMSNKIKVSAGVGGATALGKALPNTFAKAYESITSNFVGGKIAPALQAFFLASAISRASKAPKGQRLATFMDEETNGVAAMITMPMATSLMAKMGGLKYLGMDKAHFLAQSGNTIEGFKAATTGAKLASQADAVKAFRDAVAALNQEVAAGTIASGDYANRVKEIKQMLNGKTSFWQKPLKFIGKILGSNYDKETIAPLLHDPSKATSSLQALGIDVSNKAKTFMYKFKTGKLPGGFTPGGVLRFALVLFVLSPLLSKPLKMITNKIFGKPYDPKKAQEEEEKKAQEEAMKNNPFLKMNDGELMDLISKNQDTIANIQNNPQLMQEIQKNPQKLYDILMEGAAKKDEALKNAPMSSVLQKYINKNGKGVQNPVQQQQPVMTNPMPQGQVPNMQPMNASNQVINMNQGMNFKMPAPSVQQQTAPENKEENSQPEIPQPKRSYIPSSKPADFSAQQQSENARVQAILQDMDKTEKQYSKYLGI